MSVTHEVENAFGDLDRAWPNWQPYILNYFDCPGNQPITNPYTEPLNNLNRMMNRLDRGYSFVALRAKILSAKGAFKKEFKRSKFERRMGMEPPSCYAYDVPHGSRAY